MTLRHYFLLQGIESPFFTNKDFNPEDIAVFLWVLSPEFVPCENAKKEFFKKAIKVKIIDAVKGINDYLDMTFADSDTEDGVKPSKFANFIAYQIDILAHEYGWDIEYIMELSLRQVFQLNTAIGERYAKQAGEKYNKIRAVDLMQAKLFFDKQGNKKQQEQVN